MVVKETLSEIDLVLGLDDSALSTITIMAEAITIPMVSRWFHLFIINGPVTLICELLNAKH